MKPIPSEEAERHRAALVREVERDAADTASWTGRRTFSAAVMDAIARVPRHVYIPHEPSLAVAYANRPQPIGGGQTISQPYIVALMTDLLNLPPDARVLEVGTGSGYQCAVLAELAAHVFSVERLPNLAAAALAVLKEQGYANIDVLCADGAKGWSEHAPYDAIMVTAAAEGGVPGALIEQLAPGGRMVIPLGPRFGPQMLTLGVKDANGRFSSTPVLPVAFVPLVTRPE
ncbi:MAG: protein-L-isoaspartate(D-aspartate) O-methyltransferase [Alphaproteobacteria bacterium]|nr:protein-L-isoaspartate(D-aspartate) O-methyltransferase [Alphaproteobacteria bacterium]